MKSNVKVNKRDKNKIILSVGMIVKNEENHLEKCLSALKKLLDNVPSELIIVDTGSTDRTKEIALKYTDKVYDFEWIDDFAAARNCGLEKAVGEWFMFIDADEYLDENCEEMIQFFTMPEVNERYNSASIMLYNYMGNTKKAGNQFLAPRVVRRTDDVAFHDPIHEWIPQPNPHGYFSTVFHHYGYSYTNQEEKEKKADRNTLPLLEEYKKHPEDLRVLAHLCDATSSDKYFKTYDEKHRYFLEYMEQARKRPNEPYAANAFYKTAIFYTRYDQDDKALDIIDEFFDVYPDNNTVINISIYYVRISAFLGLNDYKNAYENIKKYLKAFDEYTEGKISALDLRYCVLDGLTEECREIEYLNAAHCANNIGKYEESLEYLKKIDISDTSYGNLKVFINIIRDLTRKTRKYDTAIKYYEKILELNDDDKTSLILFLLSQYYLEHPLERKEFAAFAAKSGVKGKFIDLMKICKKEHEGKDILNDIQKFIDSVTCWNDGYEEAIYIAMKYGADMSVAIKQMSNKLIQEKLQILSEAHIDFAKVVLDYYEKFDYTESIKKMLWMVTAFEKAIPNAKEFNEDDKGVFFDTFVQLLSDYVMNIYNTDLLNLEDVEVLPALHRFGYYMTLAFTALDNDEEIAYVRLLKEALRLCEPMKDVVAFYLAQFEKSLK